MIGLTAGESANPARDVPRAVKFVFWRVLVIFLGGISICIPYDDPTLLNGTSKTARSPFVIAFVRRNLPRGGDTINAIIVSSGALELISSTRKGEHCAHKNTCFADRYHRLGSQRCTLRVFPLYRRPLCRRTSARLPRKDQQARRTLDRLDLLQPLRLHLAPQPQLVRGSALLVARQHHGRSDLHHMGVYLLVSHPFPQGSPAPRDILGRTPIQGCALSLWRVVRPARQLVLYLFPRLDLFS